MIEWIEVTVLDDTRRHFVGTDDHGRAVERWGEFMPGCGPETVAARAVNEIAQDQRWRIKRNDEETREVLRDNRIGAVLLASLVVALVASIAQAIQ